MTIRFLADENLDHKTLAGLKRREPDLDIVAVQEGSEGPDSRFGPSACPDLH